MLEYIGDPDNEISYVIVHKIDRLARNREDDVAIDKVFRESRVQLISTSEPIDGSPAGRLMHGMLSAFSEFYSNNLAKEAIKGMTQKVKKGGTVSKVPLGYKNIRYTNNEGHEVATVEVDAERALLITQMFEMYVTGKWTCNNLALDLVDRGLTTASTPKIPSKPVDERVINNLLLNRYYTGTVKFQGVYHQGRHTPLVDYKTFEKCQSILKSHVNGERTRQHNHYLKSTVYCGTCGSRLMIQVCKSSNGTYYPYFYCLGRHSKRTRCKQKSILIYEVEDKVTEYYKQIEFSDAFKKKLKTTLETEIKKKKLLSADEHNDLRKQKEKLERHQGKLMEAYYDEAISKKLLGVEQDKLISQLANIQDKLNIAEQNYELTRQNLNLALDLIHKCYEAYKQAPDHIRRMFNQVFFEKILVSPEEYSPENAKIAAELKSPFAELIKFRTDKNLAESGESLPQTGSFDDTSSSNDILVGVT